MKLKKVFSDTEKREHFEQFLAKFDPPIPDPFHMKCDFLCLKFRSKYQLAFLGSSLLSKEAFDQREIHVEISSIFENFEWDRIVFWAIRHRRDKSLCALI